MATQQASPVGTSQATVGFDRRAMNQAVLNTGKMSRLLRRAWFAFTHICGSQRKEFQDPRTTTRIIMRGETRQRVGKRGRYYTSALTQIELEDIAVDTQINNVVNRSKDAIQIQADEDLLSKISSYRTLKRQYPESLHTEGHEDIYEVPYCSTPQEYVRTDTIPLTAAQIKENQERDVRNAALAAKKNSSIKKHFFDRIPILVKNV